MSLEDSFNKLRNSNEFKKISKMGPNELLESLSYNLLRKYLENSRIKYEIRNEFDIRGEGEIEKIISVIEEYVGNFGCHFDKFYKKNKDNIYFVMKLVSTTAIEFIEDSNFKSLDELLDYGLKGISVILNEMCEDKFKVLYEKIVGPIDNEEYEKFVQYLELLFAEINDILNYDKAKDKKRKRDDNLEDDEKRPNKRPRRR